MISQVQMSKILQKFATEIVKGLFEDHLVATFDLTDTTVRHLPIYLAGFAVRSRVLFHLLQNLLQRLIHL